MFNWYIASMINKMLSYTVHLLTASGVVLAFWAVFLIMQGDAANALRVLALAALVDAVDGSLARRVDVRRYTPHIDGDLLDNLVDYLTWVFLPLLWAWTFLDVPFLVCAAAMLCSMLGFAHKQAKTEDQFFRGFPSYWNLVVFYLFLLDAGAAISSVVVLFLAAMVLTPVKLVYPSRTPALQKVTLLLSVPYIVMLGVMLFYFRET
ncbi:MAG: CDP-diacylglycerol O-phosphatidyltransferase, partial [Balneolaceae bacterium]